MKCSRCQNPIPEFSNICSVCGHRVSNHLHKTKPGCFVILIFLLIVILATLGGFYSYVKQAKVAQEDPQKTQSFLYEYQKNYQSSEQYLLDFAEKMKKNSKLPKKLNQWATWMDTKADRRALHHFYLMTSDYENSFTIDYIKPYTIANICGDPSVESIFKRGYYLKFSYNLEGSTRALSYSVTRSDCPQ